MIMEWALNYFGGMLLLFLMSITLHELAHQATLEKYTGKKCKIAWEKGSIVVGKHSDYKKLSNKQKVRVYMDGVLAGLATIILASFLFEPTYFVLILPYITMSKNDLKNALRCQKLANKTKK